MPAEDIWRDIRNRGYESERTIADRRHKFVRSHLNTACATCASRRSNPVHATS